MCSSRCGHDSSVVRIADVGVAAYVGMMAKCGCRRQVWVLGVCVPCREGMSP